MGRIHAVSVSFDINYIHIKYRGQATQILSIIPDSLYIPDEIDILVFHKKFAKKLWYIEIE